jgi:hypothetical protein
MINITYTKSVKKICKQARWRKAIQIFFILVSIFLIQKEEAHYCLIVCLTLESSLISYLKQQLNQFLSFLTLYLFSFDENKYL